VPTIYELLHFLKAKRQRSHQAAVNKDFAA
jgi:hypothetical protein